MPALADHWRLIAPDYPGFGYSDTPTGFAYTFDRYADLMDRFAMALGLKRYALYLHDYGSQIGLRLAIKAPERVAALIIQNGDIYEDQLGPKYETLRAYWANPTSEGRQKLVDAVSEEGFRDEFVGEIDQRLVERIPPYLWKLSWPLMTPQRCEIMVGLMEGLRENLAWFPKYQAYLREHLPPTLIVWGPRTATCPKARRAPICGICRTLNFTCSTEDTGRWRPISRRSWCWCGTFSDACTPEGTEGEPPRSRTAE
jgi:pimeloyl-ACP methyl ester carboxylesterase